MNLTENKKIYLIVAIVLLTILSLWFYKTKNKMDVRNYPSSGTQIIVVGDSLVYGVGASSRDKNFVSILSREIGKPIVNLGISGDTTADGLKRIDELDKYNPKAVILLLGGNDYLRKVPQNETFTNLEKIIENIQRRGAIVVLLGIRGGIINDDFKSDFEKLRDRYKTAYVPNVLGGLIGNQTYMYDAIHPNDEGYRIIAEKVYPILKSVLE
jgi:acyl-CoA thioesterase I